MQKVHILEAIKRSTYVKQQKSNLEKLFDSTAKTVTPTPSVAFSGKVWKGTKKST